MAENKLLEKTKKNKEALESMQQKPSLSEGFTQALVGFLPLIAGLGSSELTADLAPVGLNAMQQLGQSQKAERDANNAVNLEAMKLAQGDLEAETAANTAAAKNTAANERLDKQIGAANERARLNREAQVNAAGNPDKKRKADADIISDIGKRYSSDAEVNRSAKLAKAYNVIKSAGPTGVGDISSLYSFVKVLDPDSAVREGEIVLGKEADPAIAKLANLYNAKVKGRITSDQFKKDLNASLDNAMAYQRTRQKSVDDYYSGIAKYSGIDPSLVINPNGALPTEQVTPPSPLSDKNAQIQAAIQEKARRAAAKAKP